MERRNSDNIIILKLTGCRTGEIVNLRWSEVDGDKIALADSKSGPRKVQLNLKFGGPFGRFWASSH